MALTIIDPVNNLTELVRVDNKTAKHVANKFAYTWLTRYPWPENVSMIMEENLLDGSFKNSWSNEKLKILLPQVGILQLTSYVNVCIRQ